MLNHFFVKLVGYNAHRKISINVFSLKQSVLISNIYLDRFWSTNYSLQWLEFHTLLATINMKFVRGYRKNKSNLLKQITLTPQLRTTNHLRKRNEIQTIGPQLFMKFYFSKWPFIIDMNSYYEGNNRNWKNCNMW